MAQRLPVLYNKKPCYDIVFQQSFDGLWEELQELGASEKKLCIVTDSRGGTGEGCLRNARLYSGYYCYRRRQ